MSTPTGRDNGLPPAARYVALVDVDPPVADHVLELLRDAGVTAVAEPLAGDLGPARDTPPPSRPTERVHVDQGHLLLARNVVGRALPSLRGDFHADAARRSDAEAAATMRRRREDLPEDAVDSLFADIVAGFDRVTQDPVPRWSVLEDAPERDPSAPSDRDDLDDLGPLEGPVEERPRLSSRLIRRGSDPLRAPVPEEDLEGHFVPEPPPPLPEADRITRLAWAALIGGPALIILAAIVGIGLEGWLVVLALGAFLGGFGTLVARMRDRPRQDDGWDDGAVL
jgi:hypothetical protein